MSSEWSEWAIKYSRQSALNEKHRMGKGMKKYECLNCWNKFQIFNSHLLKKIDTDFCSPHCKKEYRHGFREIPTLDGNPRDFIKNDGLEIYHPNCYAIDSEILKEAETYESKSKYDWDCFRFFVLLNKTRSGQFKNKWDR